MRHAMRGALMLGLAVCLFAGCTTTPLTGRSQLMLLPESQINQLALDSYKQVLGESSLSEDEKKVAMVGRVGARVARAAEQYMGEIGMPVSGYEWEFNLIADDETVNAWCMPGGKIAVYTGLLPITKNAAGLAVVVGHEIAHALAGHGNERMSQALITQGLGAGISMAAQSQAPQSHETVMRVYGAGSQVGVLLPYSRLHEREADRIGLNITALAGYDPRVAIGLWQRMNALSEGSRPPKFLSTHPAPLARIEDIKGYLPEALAHYERAQRR